MKALKVISAEASNKWIKRWHNYIGSGVYFEGDTKN